MYTPWKENQGEIKGVITVYIDVTHSVLARKKIEEKEEQLRIALDGGDLGYYDYRVDTGELIWSDRILEMFGLPPNTEPRLDTFYQLLDAEDRQSAQKIFEEAMDPAHGGSHDNTYRTVGITDGKLRWLQTKGKTIFDAANRPLRVIGVIRDITKEKTAAEALRQSEERFRNTFHNAAVGIAHMSLDGRWLIVNDRLCDLLGYTREELLTKTFQEITHPNDLDVDLQLVSELVSGKIDTYSMEKRYILKEQSFLWVNLTASLAKDKDGNIEYFITVVQDISEQKRAEEDVKQSEEQFRTLANNIQNLAWMADSDGSIFWYNQRWYEYTGTSSAAIENNSWYSFIHPMHTGKVNEFVNSAQRRGEPFELTLPLQRHDGKYRWFLTRVYPIKGEQGEVLRWVGTSTDIDEQKSVEEKLEKLVAERTRELKRSNEDLNQFAHVASHDLKEPVRKINTFSALLSEEFESLLPERGRTYLKKIEDASLRIYEMIDAILRYSTFDENDKLNERVNLHQVVSHIVTDLELSIQEKGASIQFSDLPVIEGSSVLMHQLFYNLINNALKFSRKDEKPLVQISWQPAGADFIEITLTDNGIGFRENEAQKIFKAFTRLHSRVEYEGTGLGLSLCQRITERHGGEITASGQEGVGASFVVKLPLFQKKS